MEEHELENAFHIANLIVRHLKGMATPQDLSELHHWINSNDERYELFETLNDTDATREGLSMLDGFSATEAWLRFLRGSQGR